MYSQSGARSGMGTAMTMWGPPLASLQLSTSLQGGGPGPDGWEEARDCANQHSRDDQNTRFSPQRYSSFFSLSKTRRGDQLILVFPGLPWFTHSNILGIPSVPRKERQLVTLDYLHLLVSTPSIHRLGWSCDTSALENHVGLWPQPTPGGTAQP